MQVEHLFKAEMGGALIEIHVGKFPKPWDLF
jgi:hypothetical protein